jgi:transcriptional/translational regulatory protein YebC/TACO1
MAIAHYINSARSSINTSEFDTSLSGLILCAMDYSARFATVMFMFRHRGRVRVALSEQDAAGGGVDRLFDDALAAGAEDFDQVPGADRGVEVEVRSVSLHWVRCHLMNLHLPQ